MQIFLRSASLLECKTFLASFVRRLEFDGQQVRIEYTIPVTLGDESTARSEAPNVGRIGSPSRIKLASLSLDRSLVNLLK